MAVARRHINLYRGASTAARPTLAQVVIVAALAAALVAAAATWSRLQADAVAKQVQAGEAQLVAARAALAGLAPRAAARKPDPELARLLADTEALANARRRVVDQLESGALGDTAGFSGFLRALARQNLDGLWLTGFEVGSGGADLALEGRMLDARLLPEYIRRLGAEPAFRGRAFSTLRMEAPPAPDGAAARAEPGLGFRLAAARTPEQRP